MHVMTSAIFFLHAYVLIHASAYSNCYQADHSDVQASAAYIAAQNTLQRVRRNRSILVNIDRSIEPLLA
jgi:hypothetical protein